MKFCRFDNLHYLGQGIRNQMNSISRKKTSMNAHHVYKWLVVSILLVLGSSFGLNKAFAQIPADAEKGVQVLTRGPVHEAFAETVTFDPEPGVIVPKSPPAAIEEVPPEQRLEGDNVAWIPGYWAWDDERNNFLWVSGIWRALPSGRQWMPGYWNKVEQGAQWISGYWADAKLNDVEYLPEPPATVEIGPNIAASSTDQTWLPGCWVWHQDRYAWRPGFWANVQPNWVWVPAHYVWAPRGYVFVDGYWDHSISRRGVLFAPVYFDEGIYTHPGYSYTPTTVIDLSVFDNHLFLRPRYQHYYFGDYYAANYRGAGFLPWFSINVGHTGYDPIYAHNRWQHRNERGWEERQRADFNNRRDHEDQRPSRTRAARGLHDASRATSRVGLPVVSAMLNNLERNADYQPRFHTMDPAERKQYSQHGQNIQRFREERQRLESKKMIAPADSRSNKFVPNRVKFSESPIVEKNGSDRGKKHAPPERYKNSKTDPKVIAKPRANRSQGQPKQHTVNRMPLDQPQKQSKAKLRQPDAERRQAPQTKTKLRQPDAERRQAPQTKTKQRQPDAERRQAPQTKTKLRQPDAERQVRRLQGKEPAARSNQRKGKGKNKD